MKRPRSIDTVRASRAGHTFHERWAARRALQLVFPKDNLFAIVIEGLSPNESLPLVQKAEEIADLILYYGSGDSFATCDSQQILQFKYKESAEPVTSSYLKKTIKKFSATLRSYKTNVSDKDILKKLSFGFVTNAQFSDDLWEAIISLKAKTFPDKNGARQQLRYLKTWCEEEKVEAEDIFPLIEFRAATSDLPSQNRSLRRTISDWSANSSGQAGKRLFALAELVREKAQIEGQGKNSIYREDVLDALECDEDQLFPADTRFVDVGDIVERSALGVVKDRVVLSDLPVFLHADGGVGKTVFIQSLGSKLADSFEVVIFDCFGGGSYRAESQARHLPRFGLLQIINELAIRGLCDPLLPSDSDQYGLIEVARKRLKQASDTVTSQSTMEGILIVLDAADNAQLEADARNEVAFPRFLLASLSMEPIDGVKLILTARSHRMKNVIGSSQVECIELEPFTEEESRRFLETRRNTITEVEFSTALSRSRGNARVLEYLVESWERNVSGNAPLTKISVEELIAQKCDKIFRDLHTAGWCESDVREFFAALSLLPPPIPLSELAKALNWSDSEVNSAASDLAPMLELVRHGAIFRDEPTETYIKDQYANESAAQQSIAQRLQERQKDSIYAAEALPSFLVVIGDSDRAYQLAESDEFPSAIESEYGRRRLRLARLYAAFSLATHDKDMDHVLRLTMQLSQVASANARGDKFIRNSPALATILGDSDASRRLFKDRGGWRGARDARLIVAYSFTDDLDEAHIHQKRAIGWINWHLHNDDEIERFDRSGPEAFDIAAVMFFSLLKNDFSSFNRNIQIWNFKFSLSVVEQLLKLCTQHEEANGSEVLQVLAKFAASKRCLSLTLQIGLLANEYGLSKSSFRAVSRAASSLSKRYKKKVHKRSDDYAMELQGAIANAAMGSIVLNSKQSARRLFKLYQHRRPSSYDYGERHGMNSVWTPVQSACIAAWSSGEKLTYNHLIPSEVNTGRKTKSIVTEVELKAFLDSLTVMKAPDKRKKDQKPEKRKEFSQHDQEEISKGATCILNLVKPIETAILAKQALTNEVLAEFLAIWKTALRPEIHWKARMGRDEVSRQVGLGLAKILLRYSETIEKSEAELLIEIIGANQFFLGEKLGVLALLARRTNLADVVGTFSISVSNVIVQDDYIEQRGDSYRDLASSLMPMSVEEAQEYYTQGLAQLDQMGSDDFDLIYSALRYAAEQPGGFVKPEHSHRLMNLCQSIFQHEPSKFGWILFGRSASHSIGFTAMYKLIRWDDQDVVSYSYGLPQLACYLAKKGHLDPRRGAILLTLCEDHGWHEWQIGEGLHDLLSVAKPKERLPIFRIVTEKLSSEHSFGGWEQLWKSLLGCINDFAEIGDDILKSRLHELREAAQQRRHLENARSNYKGPDAGDKFQTHKKKQDENTSEKIYTAIYTLCDPTSAASLDEAIQSIQDNEALKYNYNQRLFDELRTNCPYEGRSNFLEALCESNELEFDRALDLIIDCVEAWRDSSARINNNVRDLIKKLFAFKGSQLFELRYSGISRQIHRLSNLCSDRKFVLQTVLETIAKERLELGGDEWLQLATSLSGHTDPSTALEAFEDLLSSSATKVGEEIGEGAYRAAFAGKTDEVDVLVDIIWHLLGDSDAFVRWNAARSLKSMLDVGLLDDLGRLLDRFDEVENPSLACDEHHFAFMNAQQWLLIGLARAALHHSKKLEPLKPRIIALTKRADLHMVNKLNLARCLQHLEGGEWSPELKQLWSEVRMPAHGIIERDDWPDHKDRKIDFDFDYEFTKYEVYSLARIFSISTNEASDFVANEVIKRWPSTSSMRDFPGGVRYRRDDRFETYREHIQRHARLSAATTLVKSMPIVRSKIDWERQNPWQEYLQEEDVSFDDGSWLSDHKDPVPTEALQYLLGTRQGNQETLIPQTELFSRIGFSDYAENRFLPLYGHWTSPDGVYVNIVSALINKRGAVGQCTQFSKAPAHDLWLPSFESDGRVDRFAKKNQFDPLIWEPQKYPVGIDQGDEWAARAAIARPRLGLALIKVLGLTPDKDERLWYHSKDTLALKNEIWGQWKSDPDDHRNKYQDEGAILWAERDWLDETLKACQKSLIYKLSFSKYKSNRSYYESSGVRGVYVGLKQCEKNIRFWFAKRASEIVN